MIEMLKGTVTPKDWAFAGIVVCIALALASVYVLFVSGEQERRLEEIAAERQTVTADLELARNTRDNIEALREETAQIQALVEDFERRLPLRREIPQLLEEFEALANEVRLDVELAPQPRIVDTRKETIPYSITAYGDFHQVASFINRLERFERYLKISELSISEQRQGVCEARFTLSTYRFRQSPETGGGQS